jgi:hypothetical protein
MILALVTPHYVPPEAAIGGHLTLYRSFAAASEGKPRWT